MKDEPTPSREEGLSERGVGTPFFSVIIPTYNRATLLREALDSVFAQSFTDFEVIVVNDGSTDDTAAVVGSYGDRVLYLQQDNKGPGAARNLGIEHASGDYLAFLDSDDLWFPWTLKTMRRSIRSHQQPTIVTGQHVEFSDDAPTSLELKTTYRDCYYQDYFASVKDGVWLTVQSTAIKQSFLLEHASFAVKDINAEDHDLFLQLGVAPGLVAIADPPLVAYRRHGHNRINELGRTTVGIAYLIAQEKNGRYPGERARQRERRDIICRHVRPVILACVRERRFSDAWKLYRQSFRWNLNLSRVRFLLAFPVILASGMSKSLRI